MRILFPMAWCAVAVATLAAQAGPLQASDSALDYASVWRCDASKPNWYCDADEAAPTPLPPVLPAPENRELRTAAQLRAELRRLEDLAVMQPSDANLRRYLELWQLVQDKGAAFADSWRRVVWQHPELDYSLRRPSNTTAIRTYDSQREQGEDAHLKALAREHGLIFFFRSDCPYCHAMAPVLKLLAERYGFDVLAVSVDSAALLPEFPRFTDGRAQAQAWGVERVPALFVGAKSSGDHAPIGFGQMALTEIVQRLYVLTGSRPGQDF